LISIFGLFVFIQIPAAIAGLVIGIRSLRSSKRGLAIAGVVLSSIGLTIWLVLAYGAWDVVKHVGLQPLIQQMRTP